MNEELLKQAEIALGSSFRLMEQYYFLKNAAGIVIGIQILLLRMQQKMLNH